MNGAYLLPVCLALLTGMALATQAGVNGQLGKRLSHPLQASVISFTTGTLILVVLAVAFRAGTPTLAQLRSVPWWGWFGGAIGTLVVTTSLIFGPKVGAVAWLGLLVAGQMVASVILDHFGLAGYPVREINVGRVVGVLFLLVGVYFILRYT